jgi:uncharacterized OsmC-like protein
MPSIESIGHPLVFKVDQRSAALELPPYKSGETAVRLKARALDGMQKEAIVHHGPSNSIWRMVCDEGPYLNGTDLAPFPLGFYAAGMAFSFLSEIVHHADTYGVKLKSLRLIQDNFYTMEGSALRGDMTAGALPTEITIKISADAPNETIQNILQLSEASSPPQAYMRDLLTNTFALCCNSQELDVSPVNPSTVPLHAEPDPHFDSVMPLDQAEYLPDIITKLSVAEVKHGVEGGAGSSLRSEQKRTLHVHTEGFLRDDGLKEVEIRLFKPIGSVFKFISDESSEAAPPSLAYLSAGVGFCYMTQLGRYASIVKLGLNSYSLVQDNVFTLSGSPRDENMRTAAKSVDTHLFVKLEGSDEDAQRLLKMGEQTCFLHAAMRTSVPTRLRAEINGVETEIEPGR